MYHSGKDTDISPERITPCILLLNMLLDDCYGRNISYEQPPWCWVFRTTVCACFPRNVNLYFVFLIVQLIEALVISP